MPATIAGVWVLGQGLSVQAVVCDISMGLVGEEFPWVFSPASLVKGFSH